VLGEDQRVDGHLPRSADEERVTVGRRFGDGLAGDDARGAGRFSTTMGVPSGSCSLAA